LDKIRSCSPALLFQSEVTRPTMDQPQADQLDCPFQFSLRTLMLAVTLFALVTGLSVTFHMPEIFAAAAVVFIAFIIQRFTQVDLRGMILWCVGTEMMIYSILNFRLYGQPSYDKAFSFFIYGSVCIFLGSLCFFDSSIKSRNKKAYNFICGSMALATIVGVPMIIYFLVWSWR